MIDCLDIEDAIIREEIRKQRIVAPRVSLWAWESDILSATKKGYFTEYEIKVSRSDFHADKRKVRKHKSVQLGLAVKYFYYVCPEGLIQEEDLPYEKYGLIHITDRKRIVVVKKASDLGVKPPHSNLMKWFNSRIYWRMINEFQFRYKLHKQLRDDSNNN